MTSDGKNNTIIGEDWRGKFRLFKDPGSGLPLVPLCPCSDGHDTVQEAQDCPVRTTLARVLQEEGA